MLLAAGERVPKVFELQRPTICQWLITKVTVCINSITGHILTFHTALLTHTKTNNRRAIATVHTANRLHVISVSTADRFIVFQFTVLVRALLRGFTTPLRLDGVWCSGRHKFLTLSRKHVYFSLPHIVKPKKQPHIILFGGDAIITRREFVLNVPFHHVLLAPLDSSPYTFINDHEKCLKDGISRSNFWRHA